MKAILIVVALAAVAIVAGFFLSGRTALGLNPVTAIGLTTPVTVRVANPHGVRLLSAYVEQNGARYPLYQQTAPATRLLWSRHAPARAPAGAACCG